METMDDKVVVVAELSVDQALALSDFLKRVDVHLFSSQAEKNQMMQAVWKLRKALQESVES